MTRVAVLVPRREGQADRDATWAWVRAWWAREHPDWPIAEGHHHESEGLFNRSAAINRAARAAGSWDVAVIIDADVICEPARVRDGVTLAADTGSMVLPYDLRNDLSAVGSAGVMRGYTGSWEKWIVRRYRNMVSSVVIVPRRLWDATGGFDEEFRGWGFEDEAFGIACETFGGPLIRMPGELWHLWHPAASAEGRGSPSHARNKARARRYSAVAGDAEAIRAIRRDTASFDPTGAGIPRVLHRSVPRETSAQVEAWWDRWQALHPGWLFRTWRDPIDPAAFPLTSPAWPRVRHGAQLADLVRLEALWSEGGIYLDSDVEPLRALDPLLPLSAFAAWEDERRVPNAVMGAVPGHPAVRECIDLALRRMAEDPTGDISVTTGPGVLTTVLPGRADVLLLPPEAWYGVHYTDPDRAARMRGFSATANPWAFGLHHYAGSWLPPHRRHPV